MHIFLISMWIILYKLKTTNLQLVTSRHFDKNKFFKIINSSKRIKINNFSIQDGVQMNFNIDVLWNFFFILLLVFRMFLGHIWFSVPLRLMKNKVGLNTENFLKIGKNIIQYQPFTSSLWLCKSSFFHLYYINS